MVALLYGGKCCPYQFVNGGMVLWRFLPNGYRSFHCMFFLKAKIRKIGERGKGNGKEKRYLCTGLTERTMSKILKVRNVNDYSRYVGCKEQHPLVSVIDYAEVSPVRHSLPTVQYSSASSSSSLPRTALRQGKPSPKSPTASASNIPSTSAGCSRSRRGLRRQSMSERCDCDVLGHLSSVAFHSNSRSAFFHSISSL